MKKLILLNVFLVIVNYTFSQNIEWAKAMGSKMNDKGKCIFRDASGNLYASGYFQDTIDLDPGKGNDFHPSKGSYDVFISKYDSSGNLIWAKSIGGRSTESGESIVVDDSGNVYVTGMFGYSSWGDSMDCDPGSGKFNLVSNGSSDVFIVKLNSSGNMVWAKSYGGKGRDGGFSITIDKLNNIYLGGNCSGPVDFDKTSGKFKFNNGGSFILKLTSGGNCIWAKVVGNDGDLGYAIKTDAQNNVYATGLFYNSGDFDPGQNVFKLTSKGEEDIFIIKLDSLGDLVWARGVGGNSYDQGLTLAIDGLGNVYSSGFFWSTVDFDPGANVFNLVCNSYADIFVLKLNASGNFIWAKRIGSSYLDYGLSMVVDKNNNIYTAGLFESRVDFDPGIGEYFIDPNGSFDAYVLKLDTNGNFVWATHMGGSGHDESSSLAMDRSGNIFVCGFFEDSVDFYPGKGKYIVKVGGEGYDIFICKLKPCPSFIQPIEGPLSICSGMEANYKIPLVPGATVYKWTFPKNANFTWMQEFQGKISAYVTLDTISGYVLVTAGNSCGISVSDTLKLTVTIRPKVINQTPFRKALLGYNTFLMVSVPGNNLKYQWQKYDKGFYINMADDLKYSGTNNDTLLINEVSINDHLTRYHCVVSRGDCINVSNNCELQIICPKSITTQPLSQVSKIGGKVMFVIAASAINSTFQWQYDIGSGFVNLPHDNEYEGFSNDTLTITNVLLVHDGLSFRCIVKSEGCYDTSLVAVLNVKTSTTNRIKNLGNYFVYPTPSINFITIESSQTPNNLPYIITDQIGKKIQNGELNSKTNTVDISTLATGFYFLKIGEENTAVFKIVKQ